jgi:hypothetical protein
VTVLWSASELPGRAFDPDPDDDGDGPWCRHPDLWGNGLTSRDLDRMTDVNVIGDLL